MKTLILISVLFLGGCASGDQYKFQYVEHEGEQCSEQTVVRATGGQYGTMRTERVCI